MEGPPNEVHAEKAPEPAQEQCPRPGPETLPGGATMSGVMPLADFLKNVLGQGHGAAPPNAMGLSCGPASWTRWQARATEYCL
jgi:hypothetical protein